MSVLSEVKNENKWVFDIEVPSELINELIAIKQNEIRQEFETPGFRKGKVPDRVLKSRLGEHFGVQDALEWAVNRTCRDVIVHRKLRVVGQPEITKMGEYKPSGPLTVTLEVEVLPDVEIGAYKGLSYTATLTPVTDEDVSRALLTLRERFATIELVDSPIQLQDIAVVSMESRVQDGAAIEAWTNPNGGVRIGSGLFGEAFDQALVGKVVGDTFHVIDTFPDDFSFAEVAGQTVVLTGSVKEVRTRKVPDTFTEAMLSQLGVGEESDLILNCRLFLEKQAEKDFHDQRFSELMEQVVGGMTCTVSDTLFNIELEGMVAAEEARCKKGNTTLADELKKANLTFDNWRESLRETVIIRVKTGLVYTKIAELEGWEITDEELMAFIRQQDPKISEFQVKEMLKKSDMQPFYGYLIRERAINLLVESAVHVAPSSTESAQSIVV